MVLCDEPYLFVFIRFLCSRMNTLRDETCICIGRKEGRKEGREGEGKE